MFIAIVSLAVTAVAAAQAEDPFALWLQHSKRAAVARSPARIRVEATGIVVAGEPALHFTVTNISSAPLSLASSGLPWGNAYSINVLGIRPTGKPLPPSYPVDDPVVGEVALQSNATLEGNYMLHNALGGVREALKATDLIIVWSYGTTTGAFLFRKQ